MLVMKYINKVNINCVMVRHVDTYVSSSDGINQYRNVVMRKCDTDLSYSNEISQNITRLPLSQNLYLLRYEFSEVACYWLNGRRFNLNRGRWQFPLRRHIRNW
jgi:hypothetical protein